MSVVKWGEDWPGRGGSGASLDNQSSIRVWKIQTNNKWDNEQTIAAAMAGILPGYLEPHPFNFFLKAKKLSFTNDASSPYFWSAKVDYDSKPQSKEEQEKEQEPNPLFRPAKIEFNSVQFQKATIKDKGGLALVNVVGDPYPPQMIDDPRWVISFEKNYADIPGWVFTHNNGRNDANFDLRGKTILKYHAKLSGLKVSDLQVENDVEYLTVKGEMHLSQDPWELSLINEGFFAFDNPLDGIKVPILVKGERPSEPQLLNLDGRLTSGTQAMSGVAAYNNFDIYENVDFNDLDLE